MKPYEYTEPAGGYRLSIWTASCSGDVLVRVYDGDTATVTVPASEVPSAALALYEAAGLTFRMFESGMPTVGADGKWRPYPASILAASRSGNGVRVELDLANGAAATIVSKFEGRRNTRRGGTEIKP